MSRPSRALAACRLQWPAIRNRVVKAVKSFKGKQMVDLSVIAGGVQGLEAAGNMAQAMVDIRDGEKMRQTVISLQQVILDAQSSAIRAKTELVNMQQELNQTLIRLADYENWDKDAGRYKLADHGSSSYSYSLIPELSNGEPHHLLCANCFQQRKKSILQFEYVNIELRKKYICTQ